MYPVQFPEQNMVLRAPPGMDNEVGSMPVEVVEVASNRMFIAKFMPTPDELEKLKRGEGVYLFVVDESATAAAQQMT
jgi:hypothetical protein